MLVATFTDLRSLYADSVEAKNISAGADPCFWWKKNQNIEGNSRYLYLSYEDSFKGKLIYSDHLYVIHKFRLVTPLIL